MRRVLLCVPSDSWPQLTGGAHVDGLDRQRCRAIRLNERGALAFRRRACHRNFRICALRPGKAGGETPSAYSPGQDF
jgi:hypothetical protein